MSSSSEMPVTAKIGAVLIGLGALLLAGRALNAFDITDFYASMVKKLGETGAITALGLEGGGILLGTVLAFFGSKSADSKSAAGKAKLVFMLGFALLIAMVVVFVLGAKED